MKTAETYGLIITYTDGCHDHFKFPPQFDKAKMATLVEKLLGAASLSLQMEDRLMVIPTRNIRSAELFPVPEKLPETVLRNVQRVRQVP
jgi:hypothetical protein